MDFFSEWEHESYRLEGGQWVEAPLPDPDQWVSIAPVAGTFGFDVHTEDGSRFYVDIGNHQDWRDALDHANEEAEDKDYDVTAVEYEAP